jgi:hypothetical protein
VHATVAIRHNYLSLFLVVESPTKCFEPDVSKVVGVGFFRNRRETVVVILALSAGKGDFILDVTVTLFDVFKWLLYCFR